MEQVLAGLPGVLNIHDDILIFGEGNTLEDAVRNHDQRMLAFLHRCEEENIVLNSSAVKFVYKAQDLPFMGHIFSTEGLKADKRKIDTLDNMQ